MSRRLTVLRLAQASVVTAAAALLVVRFVAIDSVSHSASDTLRPWAIETAVVALVAGAVVVGLARLAQRGA